MSRKIIALLCVILIVASAAVGVSADYVTMLDNGLYYMRDNAWSPFPTNMVRATYISPMWAIDQLKADTTYTCTVTFTVKTNGEMGVIDLFDYSGCNYNNALSFSYTDADADNFFVTYDVTPSYDGTTSGASLTFKYDLTIRFNSVNVSGSPLYIYAFYKAVKSAAGYHWVTLNSLGMSAEYDPGGSKLMEDYLADIKDQLHKGEGYPTPDGTTLDSSVSSINSAEGAVRDKSSSLASSVSTEWNQYQTSAKNVAVTLKPAAAAVNNLYTLVIDAVPDEVIALFIAIAVLLFIGWLIGRVRE